MNLKKIPALILSAILAAAAFTGCSGGGGTAPEASTPAPESTTAGENAAPAASGDPVELTIWLTPQWQGVFSPDEDGADYDSFFKEAGRRYQEKNPDVTVKVEVIPGEGRDEKLNVAMQTDTLPDLFFESSFAMSSFMHKGAIVPINDIVTEADRADISEGLWDNCTVGDEILVFPFSHMPGTLVYNAKLFREAGLEDAIGGEYEIKTWTPDEFKSLLQQLKTSLPNVYPFGLWAKNNQADTWNLAYLRVFGSSFFDENDSIIVNEAAGVKGLEYILDLYNEGLTVPGAESLSSNDNNAMFINGQVAVSFTNTVLLGNQKAEMAALDPEFDIRLANIPGDPEPKTFTYVSGGMAMNTGDETRIAAAKDFLRYFSTDAELILASKNGTPVRASVAEQVAGELPYLAAYNENDRYMFNFSNNVPGYGELRTVLFPELQAALTGEKTAQEALDSYAAAGNKIIEEARLDSVFYN